MLFRLRYSRRILESGSRGKLASFFNLMHCHDEPRPRNNNSLSNDPRTLSSLCVMPPRGCLARKKLFIPISLEIAVTLFVRAWSIRLRLFAFTNTKPDNPTSLR